MTTSDINPRFEINPRDYPRDKAYIVCLTVWGGLIVVITGACVQWQFWIGAIFGGVLFWALIPYTLSQRNRGELLEIASDVLLVSKTNPSSSALRIHQNRPLEITVEHVEDSVSDAGIESTSTLNLWDTECGFRRRTILGIWLSEEAKLAVLDDLVVFLTSHGFVVTAHNKINKNHRAEQAAS